jgi:hypothetical protein
MNKIDALIEKLGSLQISDETTLFNKGMFVSERFHKFLPYLRKDDNIFFPASIAFLLLKNIDLLETNQRQRVDKIIDGIRDNYASYSGTNNNFIYNFYQAKRRKHYPNGFILSRFEHFKLPDDADDTVIISMTLQRLSSERISEVRERLVQFSNLHRKKIKGIKPLYAELPFYATWFGSGKMPIELEICVLCNVLYFTFSNKLELNKQDKASLELIKRAIDNNDVVENSFHISGQYPKPSVILYHIARLCSIITNPDVYFDTTKLTAMIRAQLKTTSLLEKILLSTSLMYLQQRCEPVAWELGDKNLQKDFRSFSFFTAPMLSGNTNKLFIRLKKYKLFHIFFRCEAFYFTILLEYEIMAKSISDNIFAKGAAKDKCGSTNQ